MLYSLSSEVQKTVVLSSMYLTVCATVLRPSSAVLFRIKRHCVLSRESSAAALAAMQDSLQVSQAKYPSGVQCQCMLQAMTAKMIEACRRSTLGYLLSPLIRYEHDSLRERFRPRASPAVGQGRELAGLYKPRWISDHETQVGCPRGADWLRMHRRA